MQLVGVKLTVGTLALVLEYLLRSTWLLPAEHICSKAKKVHQVSPELANFRVS